MPVEHQRAGDFHHHFVPLANIFTWRPEFIGGAGAAHDGQTLIDQQQLAVIAIEITDPTPPVQAIVEPQLDPGGRQALA
ncbi:hypothetical protein D3C72_2251140 [compost metagenome]